MKAWCAVLTVCSTLALVTGCDDDPETTATADAFMPASPVRDTGPTPDSNLVPVIDAVAPNSDGQASMDAETGADAALPQEEDGGSVCGSVTARAQGSRRPVDIIWVIDSSPSMRDEIDEVQMRLNDFTARIAASGLDFRVVLIGAEADLQTPGMDYFGICIPTPLSSVDACPDADSERYRHVRSPVHSRDGLSILLRASDQFSDFLRPGARSHLVVVSDDNHRAQVDSAQLIGAGLSEDFYFHSIVAQLSYDGSCGIFDDNDVCACGVSDVRGDMYIGLSETSGGLVLDICEDDWTPIFTGLNERVEQGSAIPCAFDIPEPVGAVIDFERVNVDFVDPDGARRELFYAEDCVANPSGWQYDNQAMPTRILLCPDVCGELEGEVEVEFGCDMRKL